MSRRRQPTNAGPRQESRAEPATEGAQGDSEPAARCRCLRTTVEAIEVLPEAEAILSQLPAEFIAAVRDAGGMDWFPMHLKLEVTRVLQRVLGPDRARAFAHDVLLRSLGGPLLRTLAETAHSLVGRDVPALLRWMPKGWRLVFRNVGRWKIEPLIPGRLVARLCELPPVCVEDAAWLAALEGSLSAILTLARCEGSVSLLEVNHGERSAAYLVRWSPK